MAIRTRATSSPTPTSKQIIFLDLGLVGQLNQQQRVDLLGLIYAIKDVDIQGIGDGLSPSASRRAASTKPAFAPTSIGSPAST